MSITIQFTCDGYDVGLFVRIYDAIEDDICTGEKQNIANCNFYIITLCLKYNKWDTTKQQQMGVFSIFACSQIELSVTYSPCSMHQGVSFLHKNIDMNTFDHLGRKYI